MIGVNKHIMRVLSILIIWCFVLSVSTSYSQPLFDTTGDWNTASNWTPAAVPSGATTAVEIKNNTSPTISTVGNTIGSVTALGTTTLTVNASSSLTLGDQTNFDLTTFANLTLNNNSTLTVDGSLIIYGDLIVNNTLTLNITGTFIVYGNVVMNNNADIAVSGTGALTIEGSLTGGTNTNITTSGSGTIAVAGDLTIQTGTVTGVASSISVGGTCLDAGVPCADAALPISLSYFMAISNQANVSINWSTATEENNDFFTLERSSSGVNFHELAIISGAGNSYDALEYTYNDNNPFEGVSYYRLKQTDFDGTTETFHVIATEFYGNSEAIQVLQNKVDLNSLKIYSNLDEENIATFYDAMGRIAKTATLRQGENIIDLSRLSSRSGIYFVRIVNALGKELKTERFIIK